MTPRGWQRDGLILRYVGDLDADHGRPITPCRETDPEVFFPETYRRAATAPAVAICRRCPLIEQCLRIALDAEGDLSHRNRYGVFGGTTPVQREQMAKALIRPDGKAA